MTGAESEVEFKADLAYSRMVAEIRAAIDGGELHEGDRVSGDLALAERYGISVTSVRKGIDKLVRAGVLMRKQGSGTYVCGMPAPREKRVSLDSIGIALHVDPVSYHPYYTERLRGLRTGFMQRGWKILESEQQVAAGGSRDLASKLMSPVLMDDWLRGCPSMAGLIVSAVQFACVEEGFKAGHPVLAVDEVPGCASVAYRWGDEVERAMRVLLEAGSRNILAVGIHANSLLEKALARATLALGVERPEFEYVRISNSMASMVDFMASVKDEATVMLRRKRGGKPFDAILACGDYEAQGLLDAAASLGLSIPGDVRLVGIINRESRLQAPCSLTALVVDGYEQGLALAEQMHQMALSPKSAPRQVVLSCRLQRGVSA